MQKQSNFLKRVLPKKSKNIQSVIYSLPRSNSPPLSQKDSKIISLKKEDICNFELIGIFDKKVLVSFNNKLNKFGYFDLHAIHQRIRYEYYCWKVKVQSHLSEDKCLFDESVIEKGGRKPNLVFGRTNQLLIQVQGPIQFLLNMNSTNINIWGINLSINSSNKVYVVGYRQILGKDFTPSEIISIIRDAECDIYRIPKVIDEWIGQYACKSAYKFNDSLKNEQARQLMMNLSQCSFPWHCVHGRTTISLKDMPNL